MTQASPVEEEVKLLKEENYRLQLRVKDLENRLFGSKADRRADKGDPQQTVFNALEEEASAEDPPQAQNSQTGRKSARKDSKPRGPKPLNPNLPRVHEKVPDPDLNELICPITGKLMRPAMVQSIEVLARKPAQYYVRVLSRNVFVSDADSAPVYHPWPNGVMPRSRVDASLIASVLVQRFADHQPYYRQCEQLKRLGLEMTPNTLMSMAIFIC
jgi:transposase